MALKMQKFEIIGVVLFVALVAIVFFSWNNNPQQQNKVMTAKDIAQFERTYGWTPPLGYTQAQLTQFIKDNPDATPEELEAGAKQAQLQTEDNQNNYNRNDYYSLPTTDIKFPKDDYSNEARELPPTTTKEQYLGLSENYTIEDYRSDYEKNLHTDNFFVDKEPTWNDVVGKFGDFGTRFLSGKFDNAKWDVGAIEEADIDGDGQKEETVYMSEDLDHSDWRILIIKNERIIFSVNGDRESAPKIIPSKNGNGFYIKWIDEIKHYGNGYCCPTGHMTTWFVFKNDKFVPAYEQEVLYSEVGE